MENKFTARVGNSSWPTSLMPRAAERISSPCPQKVRSREKLSLGTEIEVSFESRERKSK